MFRTIVKQALCLVFLGLVFVGETKGQCEVSFGYRKLQKSVKFINTSNVLFESTNRFVWSFGDGERSKKENPVHHFQKGGRYQVCLVVKDSSCGSDPVRFCTRINIENDSANCDVNFDVKQNGKTVNFINKSNIKLGDAERFVWIFGDGERASIKNPIHAYENPKKYRACLAIKDEQCGAKFVKTCKPIVIDSDSIDCKLDYKFRSRGLATKFFNTSEIPVSTSLVWNFGDGKRSNKQNPSHQYATVGTYKVCLIARDSLCGKILKTCKEVELLNKSSELVSSSKMEFGFSFKMFPNPTQDIIYLESEDWNGERVDVRIFNSIGKEVFNNSFDGEYSIAVDINKLELADGIHLLEVRSENHFGLEKLIIRHIE